MAAESNKEMAEKTPAPKGELVKLSRPLEYEGETINELRLDFDSLTGNDLEIAEREWTASGGVGNVVELNKSFLMHIVARASGKRIDVIRAMRAKDVTAATLMAQNFLLG